MKTEGEIKSQVTGVRDRVKELSGFWIGEGAAMIYVLEWVLGKRETAPAGELGRGGGDSQRIATNLAKLAEKAAARPLPAPDAARPGPGSKSSAKPRSAGRRKPA